MDFSFTFMKGIMGNTIQLPQQLIDSANMRQVPDVLNASGGIGEDRGQSYEASLQQGFTYPASGADAIPPVTNGYSTVNMYESPGKYPAYSQLPNGSVNGYGTYRNFGSSDFYLGENYLVKQPEIQEKVPSPPVPEPVTPKKTGSPEIKLRITKTYHNGKTLFESSLCGDLLNEQQALAAESAVARKQKREKKKRSKHDSVSAERQEHKAIKVEHVECKTHCGSSVNKAHRLPDSGNQTEVSTFYQVGDLVWTKVGTYPWWPCMVSCDPLLQIYTKINTRGAREYHVQFFGTVPERAWIHEKRVAAYKGRSQYEALVAETVRQASNAAEKQKILKPIAQRIRPQWDVGISQVEDALRLSREDRIEQYTFIYVDQKPDSSADTTATSLNVDAQRNGPHENVSSPPGERTALQRAVCATPASNHAVQHAHEGHADIKEPAPKMTWRTAAARKSLPPSLSNLKGNQAEKRNGGSPVCEVLPVRKNDQGMNIKAEPSPREVDEALVTPFSLRGEKREVESLHSCSHGEAQSASSERKPQRRSVRSRSESEKSVEVVPKKKMRKEQMETIPTTAEAICLQRGASLPHAHGVMFSSALPGASELSDSCKPLKKRSRASTDMEMASPGYREINDSDSRGLLHEVGLEKRLDSPVVPPDADVSDETSMDSCLSRRGAGSSKKDSICQICEKPGESLVPCEGECCRVFHIECLGPAELPNGKFTCMECTTGNHTCFSCKLSGKVVKRCSVNSCGRFYHESCLRGYSSAMFEGKGFRCPLHCCSSCLADNRETAKATKGRMMRCLRCPVAYHTGESCIAAGSLVLSPHSIICNNHSSLKKSSRASLQVNVSWCFICARGVIDQDQSETLISSYTYKSHYLLSESNRSAELLKKPMIPPSPSTTVKKCVKGGRLLCCETCPASFHPECLNIEMPEGNWYCNNCKVGKKSRYKEIVWVKLGIYRWWPAEICNPKSVPLNIQAMKHHIGEFPVRFFGSNDYYWVHQGRVFPYLEGDKGNVSDGRAGGINEIFKKALEEAAKRFQELKALKECKEALENERNERKPPAYRFIKANKPVGKVQIRIADMSEIPRCNCKPTDENPCGLDSECLNRILMYECHPAVCPAGEKCQNQCFSKRLYPDSELVRTDVRGWGLRTKVDIKKGQFVTEYVGELIDEEECRNRIKHAHEANITNFYLLTLTKDRIIDAGPKGNLSRFMNHSCNPNCETQKWTVMGDARVGLFALCDVRAGSELTFNYNLDCLGNGKTVCKCGAPNCSGYLGVRPKTAAATANEEKAKNAKKKLKKRKTKMDVRKMHEDYCFRCCDGGELVMCDKKDCPKAYHLSCLNLTKPPFGKWECPWHHCNVCGTTSTCFCDFCPSSYCREHQKGALTTSALEGRPCCSEHDPSCPAEFVLSSSVSLQNNSAAEDTGEETNE
ncbi:histone-lysine N-methyltransferase NSD3 isoform X2 [Leucoraja erinacea]|uniref:histone-lysine N-methyltransferase NSD3 isoform X2 n=1 Tax=Leucoraja erinaceus TaxID=7782 RepID=UPI0024546292|nr:histone-lysine N-methyltransferase NSD3 isoform X2 [Leucoraja erinacea]